MLNQKTICKEIQKPNKSGNKLIIFKRITYPGCYSNRFYVSENGDVYNLETDTFVSQNESNSGYMRVSLDGNTLLVHRLVAWEFYPDRRDMKLTVDHIDGNKKNNWYTNLEWVTLEENIRRAYLKGLHNTGYSENLIREICELYETGKTPIDVYRIIKGTNNTPRGNKENEAFYRLLVSLRNKEIHLNIVSQYNFPKVNGSGYRLPSDETLFNKDQIKMIAYLYTIGKNYADILRSMGYERNRMDVSEYNRYYYLTMRICRRESWTNITDDIFNNHKGEIVTVKNGSRFSEDQVRSICIMVKNGTKNPEKLLANIGITKSNEDYHRYYDATIRILNGRQWRRISKDYFEPMKVFANKKSFDWLDEEFIFEMFNKGYNSGDIARMYGLGSKKENPNLYKAMVDKLRKFKKIKDTLEFKLSEEDIENISVNIWASQA